MRLDTKTYWLTDRQSQFDCDFDLRDTFETTVRRVGVSCETVASHWGCENGSWGSEGIGTRYQATTGEATADWKDFARAVLNWKVRELAIALQLFVVTFCTYSINPITNPNTVYSDSCTWIYDIETNRSQGSHVLSRGGCLKLFLSHWSDLPQAADPSIDFRWDLVYEAYPAPVWSLFLGSKAVRLWSLTSI
jgi:hypothetical protein